MDGIFAWEMIHGKRYYHTLAKCRMKSFARAAVPTRPLRFLGVPKGKDN